MTKKENKKSIKIAAKTARLKIQDIRPTGISEIAETKKMTEDLIEKVDSGSKAVSQKLASLKNDQSSFEGAPDVKDSYSPEILAAMPDQTKSKASYQLLIIIILILIIAALIISIFFFIFSQSGSSSNKQTIGLKNLATGSTASSSNNQDESQMLSIGNKLDQVDKDKETAEITNELAGIENALAGLSREPLNQPEPEFIFDLE